MNVHDRLGVFVVGVMCVSSCAVAQTTMSSLDLNAATASLRTEETGAAFSYGFGHLSSFAFVVVLLALGYAKTNISSNTRKLAQWAAAHLLVYVLSGIAEEQEVKALPTKSMKPATRINRKNSMSSRPRSAFGLTGKLEQCTLERTYRREAATRLENTLMQARLDQATLGEPGAAGQAKPKPRIEFGVFNRFPKLVSFTCEETSPTSDSEYASSQTTTPDENTHKSTKGTKKNKDLRRRGKPDLNRVREMQQQQGGYDFDLDEEEEEVQEFDWESEQRAAPCETDDNFDGEDVGCDPRELKLPKSVGKAFRLGVCGRSILEVPWEQVIRIHGQRIMKEESPPTYPEDWASAMLRRLSSPAKSRPSAGMGNQTP